MTKQEAINIKNEILEKEGTVNLGNTIRIVGVVFIKDIFDIIDKYISERKEKE